MLPAGQSGNTVFPCPQMRIIAPVNPDILGVIDITCHRKIGDGRAVGRGKIMSGKMLVSQFEGCFHPSAQKFGRPRLTGFCKGQQKPQSGIVAGEFMVVEKDSTVNLVAFMCGFWREMAAFFRQHA